MSRPPSSIRALLATATLCFGGLVVTMTQTVVIPIQGRLPSLLDTSVADAGWVVTATLLAGAVTMPISGRLGDSFGKRRVIVASAAVLVAGSVLSGMSDTLPWVVAGRALQGMAMGIIPVGLALLRDITPPQLTSISVAAMSTTLGVGPAVGLVTSAWLAETSNWHWLFWISAILGAVLAAAALAFVPPGSAPRGGRVDFTGALGLAVGLVAVLVGLSKSYEWGWSDPRTLGSVTVGATVLVAWCVFELRAPEPVVDLRVATRRPVLLTNLAAVGIGFSMMALGIVLPQLLQLPAELGGLGQSVLETGLWMAPGGLLLLVVAPVAAKMLDTVGARLSLVVGSVIIGCGYICAGVLMDAPWKLLLAMCVGTIGVGISQAAMPTLIMEEVPATEAGAAVGLTLLMRSVGQTTAAAAMATVLSGDVGPEGAPTTHAYRVCFIIGAVAAFIGAATVAFVPRRAVRTTASFAAVVAPTGALRTRPDRFEN